jgi:hypothetical protein
MVVVHNTATIKVNGQPLEKRSQRMSKIQGKDFAKTVVITPEENEAIQRKTVSPKKVTKEEAMGGDVKGPPKGLSGWSVFFLIVIGVVLCFGIVAMLIQLKVLPSGY